MKAPLSTTMLTPGQCATVLTALGDETRLRIMESLLLGEKCVTDLVREMKCTQPHASHHLRILRNSGLVEGRRDGKQICYRVTPRIQRALANRQGQTLDFNRCKLRFPEATLLEYKKTISTR